MNKKCGLRMAQGGLVQGDERAALYAKYGIKPGGSAPAAQPTPQPVAQPTTPTQKPQAGGLLNQATSALSGRRVFLIHNIGELDDVVVHPRPDRFNTADADGR